MGIAIMRLHELHDWLLKVHISALVNANNGYS